MLTPAWSVLGAMPFAPSIHLELSRGSGLGDKLGDSSLFLRDLVLPLYSWLSSVLGFGKPKWQMQISSTPLSSDIEHIERRLQQKRSSNAIISSSLQEVCRDRPHSSLAFPSPCSLSENSSVTMQCSAPCLEQSGEKWEAGISMSSTTFPPLAESMQLSDGALFCHEQVEEKLRECNERNKAMQDISIDELPSDPDSSQVG